MFDLQGYIERAMLLNMETHYIDENETFFYSNGQISMIINDYMVKSDELDIEANIEMPEGVTIVYLHIYRNKKTIKNKRYTIVFPSTLIYFGTEEEENKVEEGCISIKDYWYDFASVCDLSNVSFDFRKCLKLTKIRRDSFFKINLNELYLPDTITEIEPFTFKNSTINKIIAKGVVRLGRYAFHIMNVNELELNEDLEILGTGSLNFNKHLDKFIFKNRDILKYGTIRNIKHVYLPYDLEAYSNYYINTFSKIIAAIEEDKTDVTFCKNLIQKFSANFEQLDAPCVEIESYLSKGIGNLMAMGELLSETSKFFLDNVNYGDVYYYNVQHGYDNVENRDYKRVIADNRTTIYVEV